MAMLWNFSEWMNRLGLLRQAQPELIYGVQPVVVMGDQSALVSPVLPPMAWAGGRRSGIAAVFSCLSLTSVAAGGTFIRTLMVGGANKIMRFQLTNAPAAKANLVALAAFDMAPDPVVSVPLLGTLAAQPGGGDVPVFDVAGTGSTFIIDGFYIEPGRTLEMWVNGANLDLEFAMQYEDLPATVPRS